MSLMNNEDQEQEKKTIDAERKKLNKDYKKLNKDKKEVIKIKKGVETEKKKLIDERKDLKKERKCNEKSCKKLKKLESERENIVMLSRFSKFLLKHRKAKQKEILIFSMQKQDIKDKIEERTGSKLLDMDIKDIINNRVEVIAMKVAEDWNYGEILAAVNAKPKGSSVHGYLQANYEDYKKLVREHSIIDRAAYYSRRKWVPDPLYLLSKIDLTKYVKTGVEFDAECYFDHLPEQTFKKAIIYATDNLNNAVVWGKDIQDDIRGFITNINLAYCNIVVINWAAWNLPMILITHAPGKDHAVFKATLTQNSAEHQTLIQQKKIIIDLRKKMEPLKEKSLHYEEGEKEWRKFSTKLRDRMVALQESKLEKDIKQIEHSAMESSIIPAVKQKASSVLLIICVLGFSIFVIMMIIIASDSNPAFGNNETSTTNSTKSLSLIYNLFKCVRLLLL